MQNSHRDDWQEAARVLNQGGCVVAPTDTVYGVLARALDVQAVNAVYALKGRNAHKPLIVLIASLQDLEHFSVALSFEQKKFLDDVWPGPVSVLLPCTDDRFSYVHRGTHEIAFRMPQYPPLRDLILRTGPLVAPSANPEGAPPAHTVSEARAYFGDNVEVYVDGGNCSGDVSTLVRFKQGTVVVLREGVWKPSDNKNRVTVS